MKRRKFLVSLLLALLMLPLHVFAEEPTYAFTDAEVLARGQLYYSSLNQFFSNVANDNGNAAEVTLTGAIGFCDTDYWVQSEFDARVAQGTTYGPCLYIEYVVTDQNGHSKTGYSYDLLPVGGHFNEGLAKLNYTTAVKNFSGGSGISILGNNFVKDSLNYKVRIDLSDYAAKGYSTTKTQVDAARAAKVASIVETPERYYANLEKLLMTFDSNTQTNEVIVCVKGIYTDDELASISYTDDSKIQYWLDYTTVNLNLKQVRVKKAYSVLGSITVIGNASEYNKMALIANGGNPSYTEIAPGMYRNADGWTVFRVNLSDYTAKGYVY